MTPTACDWTYGNIPVPFERVGAYECASTTFTDERDLTANDFSEQFYHQWSQVCRREYDW